MWHGGEQNNLIKIYSPEGIGHAHGNSDYYASSIGGYTYTGAQSTYSTIKHFEFDSNNMIFQFDTGNSNVYTEVNGFKVYFGKTLTEDGKMGVQVYLRNLEDQKPVLSSGQVDFVSNYDNPATVSEIKSKIKAYDDVDGEITNKIVVKSNNYYDESKNIDNRKVIGKHPIVFSVTDTAGNEATMTVYVVVVDVTAPVITGPASIEARTDVLLTNQQIIDKFTATDNVDGNVKGDIVIAQNSYSANYGKPGNYSVVLEVTDNAGVTGTFTTTIVVKDKLAPVFSGPTLINKSQSQVLTISQIKSQLTATDNVDGNVSANIEVKTDNYTGFGHKVGSYTIVFKVTDKAGNIATHSVEVKVTDDVKPYFIIDGTLFVEDATQLSIGDLVEILRTLGKIDASYTQYEILMDDYTENSNVAGTYAVSLLFTSNNGSENLQNMVVEVYSEGDNVVELPEETLKEKFDRYYKELLEWFEGTTTIAKKEIANKDLVLYSVALLLALGIISGVIIKNKKEANRKGKKGSRK